MASAAYATLMIVSKLGAFIMAASLALYVIWTMKD